MQKTAPKTKTQERPKAPPIAPILLSDEEAGQLLGIGTSYLRKLVADGTVAPTPVRLGKRRLHRRDLLELWVQLGLPGRTDPQWRQASRKIPAGTAMAPAPSEITADGESAGHAGEGRA